MWKSKSTLDFIIAVSLITILGITIGSILPLDSIQAQQDSFSDAPTQQDSFSDAPTQQGGSGNAPTQEGGSGNAPTQQDSFSDAPTQQDSFSDAPTQEGGSGNASSEQSGTSDVTSEQSGTSDIASQNIDLADLYFTMDGIMSSFITTPTTDFVVVGNWTLKTEGGNLSDFNAEMRWSPTNVTAPNIRAHEHSFSNFIPDPNNQKIALNGTAHNLGETQTISIDGVMDVGAGVEKTKWPAVPANLKIAGDTITISLDDSKTGGHFNNYPVFGEIENTKPCTGPKKEQYVENMQVIDVPTCPS